MLVWIQQVQGQQPSHGQCDRSHGVRLAGSDRPPLLERLAQLFSLDAAARSAASSPPDLASRLAFLYLRHPLS